MRWLAVIGLLALSGCTASPGSFTVRFGWAGGTAPTHLPSPLYLYGYIVAPGSSVHIATAGPDTYASGEALKFANVPNGRGLLLTLELRDSPGDAAQVIAYGESAPFSLEPGQDVEVDVTLQMHPVTSVPTTGGIQVNGLTNGEVSSTIISLELFADASAVGARISNLPALPEAPGTVDVAALTPDPTGAPPKGFKAFRYTGWNLDAGLEAACAPGTLCQRSVYVFFTDANGIPSETSSTTITLNRLVPSLLTHVNPTPPAAAGLTSTEVIAATPSEPLQRAPVPHVYKVTDPLMMSELSPDFLTVIPGTEYTFQHEVSSNDANGTYFVTFDLIDDAGNMNTWGTDQSVQFMIDTTVPQLSALMVTGGKGLANALFSQLATYNQVAVRFTSSKTLTTCAVSINQHPVSCTNSALSYACTYQETGQDAEGTYPISVVAFDEAGNQAVVPNTSVIFDYTPPTLVPSSTQASLPYAGVGQTETLSLTPSEALQAAPVLLVTGPATLTFAPANGPDFTFSYTVQSTDSSGSYTSVATMTDLVGNTNASPVAGPAFKVDTVVPAITLVKADAQSYSDMSGHNQVTVTFDEPKSVDPTGLVVTLAGRRMMCQPWSAMVPNYTCTYGVSQPTDTNGPQTIEITATDEANNTQSGSTTVVFDFMPLVLAPTVAPNPANGTSSPVLTIAASKPLPGAPTVTVTAQGSATGTVTASPPNGSGTSWSSAILGTGAAGTFNLGVQATDDVGHVGTASTPFTIQAVPPALTIVPLTQTTYSEMSGFNQLRISFDSSEVLDAAPPTRASLTVKVGSVAMTCTSYQAASPNYVCTHTVSLADPPGTQSITIVGIDSAGNQTTAGTSVTFDFTAPTLTPSVAPNPANAAAAPALTVASDKPLPNAPTVVITPNGTVTGTTSAGAATGGGTSWGFPIHATVTNGTFTVAVHGVDAVGHGSNGSTTFTVDSIVPAISGLTPNFPNFSEVSPFNVVVVTFNTPKAATITAAVGVITMTCGAYQSTAPSYTCTSRALAISDGSGTEVINVTATDEAGNASAASKPVVFDFVPLSLTVSAAPNPVNASSLPPVLTVASNKPLLSVPAVSVTPEGLPTGQLTVGSFTPPGGGTSWTVPIQLVGATVAGSFTLAATATDDVGHSNTASDALEVNNANPIITNVALNATRFSGRSGFNSVHLAFNYTDDIDTGASQLTAAIGGFLATGAPMAITCGAWQPTAPNYSCLYSVTGTERAGDGVTPISTLAQTNLPITIQIADSVGNRAFASTSATFDFMPPALSAPPAIQYLPAPNIFTGGAVPACAGNVNVLTSVTAATTCTQIRASFTMTESLSANPTVTAASGAIAFQATTASGVSYVFDGVTKTAGTPPDSAAYGVTIAATDLVGNPATLAPASPTFELDTTPPAVPSATAGGAITYSRTPWGSKATSGIPAYSVAGSAGAAEANGTIFVYDGPATTFDSIGDGAVLADGSFKAVALERTDRPAVYIAAADEAGNQSAAVAVHNVSWTASFNAKVPGSTVQNPSTALADPFDILGSTSVGTAAAESGFLGPLHPSATVAPELSTYAGLATGSVAPLLTTAQGAAWAQAPANSPPARWGHALAFDSARGVSVVFGGRTASGSGSVNDTWEWDGTTWTQRILAVSPPARFGPSSAYDSARGVTVLFGGEDDSNNLFGDTWEWNGTSWTLRTPVNSPPARYFHAMVYDASRGVTVLFAGTNSSGVLADTWEWDGQSWTQLTPASSPPARYAHAMAYDSARRVSVVFAGESTTGTLDDTWEWNGTTWTARSPATSPAARFVHAMAYDSVRGVTVLFGGGTGSTFFTDTWEWNGTVWTARSPATNPSGRLGGAMAYDSGRGVTVVFGGSGATVVDNDTWEWNGSAWRGRAPLAPPTGREAQGMAYDSARGVTVLFGGSSTGTNALNDTWEWDGTTWTQMSPATVPAARYQHAMAYDSARGVTVLFGGYNLTADLNDTWEWNGTTWTQRTANGATGSPPIRESHAMVYDSARGVSVLFGGYDFGSDKNDTWEWNGTSWTQRTVNGAVTSPPAREYHSMTYDSGRGVTVLFGGYSGTASLGDTWEWNGTSWTQRSPATAPAARYVSTAAYDSARGLTVLTGGNSGSGALGDTWEWNGASWTQLVSASSPSARGSSAMVYDSIHGQSVLFGGGNNLSDTWLLSAGNTVRATNELEFDFGATGETFKTAAVEQVTISATAGGTGYSSAVGGPLGSAVPGVFLAAWDFFTGGSWRVWGANTAPAAAPAALTASITSAWQILHELYSPGQTIDIAVSSIQPTGNGSSADQLSLGDPELTVQYQHSESPCTVTSTSACACAADETQCGSICADLACDPQNCGTCGVTCTGGMACIASACACPGSEVVCNGTCTDRSIDPDNCGACGTTCGAYKFCVAGTCSPCQAGQALVAGSCVTDLAVRSSTNQAGGAGTVQILVPATVVVGDQLVVVAAPYDKGGFTAAVASGSGQPWSLVGFGTDAAQYLAIYTKVAQAGDIGQDVTVTMNTVVSPITGENLNATLIDVYSQSGASISLDVTALRGGAIGTAAALPAISATAPNELVLIAAAQVGATQATLPAGTTALTRDGGFVTGRYALTAPGPAPTLQLTAGSATASWELAQIAFASGAH